MITIIIYTKNTSCIVYISLQWQSFIFCFSLTKGQMLETLDHTIRIGSTPTFLYFDLYLYSAYAAHYVYYRSPRFACQHQHLS